MSPLGYKMCLGRERKDEKYPCFHFIFHLGLRQTNKQTTPTWEQVESEAYPRFNELMYKNPAPIFWLIFHKYLLSSSSPTFPGQRLVIFLPNPCLFVFSSWTHCQIIFPTTLASRWAMGLSSSQWNVCGSKECLLCTWPPKHPLRFYNLPPPSSAATYRGLIGELQGSREMQRFQMSP